MVYDTDNISEETVAAYVERLRKNIKENFQCGDSFSWSLIEDKIIRARFQKDWIGLMFLGKEIDLIILNYRLGAAEETIRNLNEKIERLENFGKKTE